MKHLFIVLALSLISCNNSQSQTGDDGKDDGNMTTLYLIRHAEKQDGSDPELTMRGEQRADQWVNYFFLKDVDHVITTDTRRTRATAAPLAQSKKMEAEIYDVSSTTGKSLLETYRGKTVVVFGHSNTINTYANDLQSDRSYEELDESDFDHYFIVKIDDKGNSSARKEVMDFELE